MSDDPRDELSPAEARAFEALPREVPVSPSLEERTVAMLREHGQLPYPLSSAPVVWQQGAQGHRGTGAQRSARRVWLAGAIAAGLALFATGLSLGQYLGARTVADVAVSNNNASAVEAAADIQRAGTMYLAALASLSQLPDTADMRGRAVARQVALSVLGAAAQEVALLAPDDPLAAAVLRGLDQRSKLRRPAPPSRTVVWF